MSKYKILKLTYKYPYQKNGMSRPEKKKANKLTNGTTVTYNVGNV